MKHLTLCALSLLVLLLNPARVRCQQLQTNFGATQVSVTLTDAPTLGPSVLEVQTFPMPLSSGLPSVRVRHSLIGAGIGAVAGSAVWLCTLYCTGGGGDNTGVFITPVFALSGAVVGGVIGALWPVKPGRQ